MRISTVDCRWSSDFFSPKICKKYRLNVYSIMGDKDVPVIFYGCYGVMTKRNIMNHRSLVVIVWSGSDSQRLHEFTEFVDYCVKNKDRVFHIAHSHWIQTDLAHWGLEYIDKVVFPVDLSKFVYESETGNSVYHYGSKQREWYYGTHLMKKIRDRWDPLRSFPNMRITNHGAYTQGYLYDIYKDSFVGVRLTEHDNMALSCVELGLMGRYSIFNGNIPCAIEYGQNYDKYDPGTRQAWCYQDESLKSQVEKDYVVYLHKSAQYLYRD